MQQFPRLTAAGTRRSSGSSPAAGSGWTARRIVRWQRRSPQQAVVGRLKGSLPPGRCHEASGAVGCSRGRGPDGSTVQVLEAKDEAVAEGRYEEAALLRERELDLKAALVAPAERAPRIALVDTPSIEQVRPAILPSSPALVHSSASPAPRRHRGRAQQPFCPGPSAAWHCSRCSWHRRHPCCACMPRPLRQRPVPVAYVPMHAVNGSVGCAMPTRDVGGGAGGGSVDGHPGGEAVAVGGQAVAAAAGAAVGRGCRAAGSRRGGRSRRAAVAGRPQRPIPATGRAPLCGTHRRRQNEPVPSPL